MAEMGSAQERQRARSTSQLATGTFSNHASWRPHFGQRERGRITLSSAGQRSTQTFVSRTAIPRVGDRYRVRFDPTDSAQVLLEEARPAQPCPSRHGGAPYEDRSGAPV